MTEAGAGPTAARWPRSARLGALVAATLVLVALAGACAGGGNGTTSATSTASDLLPPVQRGQALPPDDVAAIRAVYGPALERLGVRLTRAGLYDTTGGAYDPKPDGTHLALYVRPLADHPDAASYAEGMWTTAALVTPDVFARWPGLQSYDICQEAADVPEPQPPAETQVALTREAAATVDWSGGSLTDLLALSRRTGGVTLVTSTAVRASAPYRAALDRADATAPATTGG